MSADRDSRALRGFVLEPSFRLERGRGVVWLAGVLETGESFLVREHRAEPYFYVRAEDVARLAPDRLRGVVLAETDRGTFRGEPVVRLTVGRPAEVSYLAARLEREGVRTYEADVRFASRFLIDRGLRGSLAIRGPSRRDFGFDRVFDDPELTPADWTPRLSVLAFDLETDPGTGEVLAAALVGSEGASEVLMRPPTGQSVPEGVTACATEGELLATFCRRVREIDPDVLTGWNIVEFDLPVLVRAAERWGGLLELGRAPGSVRLARQGGVATVPGRAVLDGLRLVRGASIRLESYRLDAVARHYLGRGKVASAGEGGQEILVLWHGDRERLAEYNRVDAELALEIVSKLQLVELAVERSRLTGLPPDRLGSSIAAFDFLYLMALGRRGTVARTLGSRGAVVDDTGLPEIAEGGHVLEPVTGLHEQVWVFDFKSLYPSVIRTFGIDPLNFVPNPEPAADVLRAPNGAAFRRTPPGILPGLLDELMPRREAAQRAGDGITAYAIKILMNSFYGVLATSACRFADQRIANAITSFGRVVLLETKRRIEALGYRVLYGDTDSLFVASGCADGVSARARGPELAARLTRELTAWVRREFRVESRLVPSFQTVYAQLLLPAIRGSERGARKRYAGWVEEPDGGGRVVFVGMEAVRSDWTELGRRVQKELYERFFRREDVAPYLIGVLADLRAGRLDDQLVYKKRLRKEPAAYTATTPPHVAAARKAGRGRSGTVSYVVTTAGPEPVDGAADPLDYEHYVDKQLRPVALPVLERLGLDFEEIAGRGHQLGLFKR
ncbi:MAG: DNA polymerase II [Thermoanaerobaculia bacterium]|nr:DNA polymerase II [Thermoanaerobaculia bacterium]